jgi:hypothetical protein
MNNNMINVKVISLLAIISISNLASAQTEGSFFKPNPPNYLVTHAVEVESLFPMFFYGGYHVGLGYRFKKFRVRVSVINGGTYDAESAGISNNSDNFKRYYKPSPGIFLGYNLWKNLECYGFLENHTFAIEQKSTGVKQNIHSIDYGGGIGYQFFIGRYLYIQPAFHIYMRSAQNLQFDNQEYTIPTMDLSPVIRVGVRLWKQFPN